MSAAAPAVTRAESLALVLESHWSMPLLAMGSDAKTSKGEPLGYDTGILYMVPADGSGLGNLCVGASAGCRVACLFSAGRGRFVSVADGRMRKTRQFFANSVRFVDTLARDIARLEARARRYDRKLCIRLNGTSDIPWERLRGSDGRTLFERFPGVQFYDYTKRTDRRNLPDNYHVTFSLSESNAAAALAHLERGFNVAAVFSVRKGAALPASYLGRPVIDGDLHDLRFLDPAGVIVGLRAKGDAKGDASGFAIGP